MQALSVVIAQKDQANATQLAQALSKRFRRVLSAHSSAEIIQVLSQQNVQAAIVDLELITSKQLQKICEGCHRAAVVATHRSPDEEMWMACMRLGAADCCHHSDVDAIVRAIAQNVVLTRAHAA